MSATTKAQYNQAVSDIATASKAYYTSDALTMDDASYDALLREVARVELSHPEWVTTNTTTAVAAGALDSGDVPHSSKMLSLDNAMDDNELGEWFHRLKDYLGNSTTEFVVEPKLDGCALSVTYVDGLLVRAATRGDGSSGDDVTARARTMSGLPVKLSKKVDIELRGEVLMTNDDYATAQSHRAEYGKPEFTNRRSAASGGVRNSNLSEIVPLTFSCYGAYGHPAVEGDYVDSMNFVRSLGVVTARERIGLPEAVVVGLDAIRGVIDHYASVRDSLEFEIDGAVIKANKKADRESAGESSKAPRWAIARKYPAQERLTTLVGVNWQVGRTGVITPRAHITPTEVGGVTVSFASMHNVDHIERNGWMIGDIVGIRRAGDVVPELMAPLVEKRPASATLIELPKVCPQCGADIDKSQARWRCSRGRQCGAVSVIEYAASRDALDVEGMGSKLITQLVESGRVVEVADLFTLTTGELTKMDRMGETSAQNIVTQIERARSQSLARFITALGIRGTGRSLSRRLAATFSSLAELRDATAKQLSNVDGIGDEKSELILSELKELNDGINRLIEMGLPTAVSNETSIETRLGQPLAGMTVVVTGSMTGSSLGDKSRNEMNEIIESAGGKSSSSVSKNTSLVVAGEAAGSKLTKANELGIKVISPDEFTEMLRQ